MRAAWLTTWVSRLALCALALGHPAGVLHAEDAPAEAQATDPRLREARTLFQRGVALAEQRQFVAAAQRFREALAIHYAPAVAYNLAAAQFELKQYDASFEQVQSVLRDEATSPELRERAQQLEQALASHVARLTVLASGSGAEGAVVRVDGQVLERALFGAPRAVAPGTHRVSAERRGERVSERAIEVPAGTSVIIDVSLIVTDPAGPTASAGTGGPSATTLAAAPHDDGGRKRKIWIWTSVAAGVAVLGAGVALAVVLTRDDPNSPTPTSGDFMPGVLTWR